LPIVFGMGSIVECGDVQRNGEYCDSEGCGGSAGGIQDMLGESLGS